MLRTGEWVFVRERSRQCCFLFRVHVHKRCFQHEPRPSLACRAVYNLAHRCSSANSSIFIPPFSFSLSLISSFYPPSLLNSLDLTPRWAFSDSWARRQLCDWYDLAFSLNAVWANGEKREARERWWVWGLIKHDIIALLRPGFLQKRKTGILAWAV